VIDGLLNKISKHLFFTDDGKKSWGQYEALTQHNGWRTHQALLVSIMNEVSTYMLSPNYTKLDKDEKDIQQRAFYIVKETANFLLDPLANARKYAAINAANTKGKGSKKRKQIDEPGTKGR
jgi:hypothetical protein